MYLFTYNNSRDTALLQTVGLNDSGALLKVPLGSVLVRNPKKYCRGNIDLISCQHL